jgi:hypothetical protein
MLGVAAQGLGCELSPPRGLALERDRDRYR